jgi:hypothetical protein
MDSFSLMAGGLHLCHSLGGSVLVNLLDQQLVHRVRRTLLHGALILLRPVSRSAYGFDSNLPKRGCR